MFTQDSIAASGYEGWVAWTDGTPVINPGSVLIGYDNSTPLFEAVPHNPYRLGIALDTGKEREVRATGRQTMDWKDLPHARVNTLELYGFRSAFAQPVITIMRQLDRELRWIQYKRGAVVVQTLIRAVDEVVTGQERTGITGWVVGYWDMTAGHAKLWEFNSDGSKGPILEFEGSNHPCWSKPLGFGLAPMVLGLKDSQVPECPVTMPLLPAGAFDEVVA